MLVGMLARRLGLGGRIGRRSTTAWLAVLAVLAQAVLFDLAMAAREAAEAQAQAWAAAAHHHEAPGHGREAPRGHKHREDCPFCVARATHQAPAPPDGVAVPAPLPVAAARPALPRARVRARRRPTRFRSRSPPGEACR
jgi:hypothetical protein